MGKIVRKLRPNDYWRIGEHESWFTDMAAEGLYLKKMGLRFAKFAKGEPKKMRYRIDVSFSKKITSEQIDMYAESGWDYVTSYSYFHVFSSPAELHAPELHTDPAEQSYTLKALDEKYAQTAWTVTIMILLTFGMLASIWFLDGTPTLMMVEGNVLTQTILTIILGYSAYNSLQAAISIRSLRKKLAEGKPIDHHAPWKKRFRRNSAISLLFILTAGSTAAMSFAQLSMMDTKTLPEGNIDLPIVRLADIEQNPDLIRAEPSYVDDDVDWGNRISYDWSPLAPVQYETDENGEVIGEKWYDGSGRYSPSIQTQVYQLSIAGLADNLLSDLVKRYRYEDSVEEFVQKKNPALEELIVYEEEGIKKVFASKGKTVIYVWYHGKADVDSVIEAVVENIR
ncbi:DUF2812 domain-containing protein [Bacillus sp. MMSF_3328]|uniref:DUF2812 domain-containing protein n=1 Tax=Bacillus sp. MMSF_3328 TaxID=3047080 RepID=UPI00273DAEA7|nr:DUF2812 domain-containing protein [Bacillus sp. MMSF_3328]